MKAIDLQKRLPKKKLKSLSELRQLIANRPDGNPNFALFLGAGASATSNIRTAAALANQWREEVYRDLANTEIVPSAPAIQEWLKENASDWYEPNQEYASLIEKRYPLLTHRRKFIEAEVSDKTPSIGYAYLVRIAEKGAIRTVFTTNFDDLLNEAFYQFSSERPLVCAHDSSIDSISITARRAKIIKLHGDYLFENIKTTTTETSSLEANMRRKLEESLKEYGLIISGYSGSDRSITKVLDDLLTHASYLRNGLFWCFRPEDAVTENCMSILQKENAFYVIVPGFDELMAELYTLDPKDATPFNSKLANNRATSIIDSYLNSPHLKNTKSEIIRRHLQVLQSDRNASVLSSLWKELNADSMAASGLTESNLVVFLEIERALKARDPEAALLRLDAELQRTADKRFKELLLRRRFQCSTRLGKLSEAIDAARQVLELEPANFFISLRQCALHEKREDRLKQLKTLQESHPYSPQILNTLASETSEGIDACDPCLAGKSVTAVSTLLAHSLELDPSFHNSAWAQLFECYSGQGRSPTVRSKLEEIIDKHLKSAPYSENTCRFIYRYCKKFESTSYKGTPIFDLWRRAYDNHFPRERAAHLAVLVDICAEFDGQSFLLPILQDACGDIELKKDSDFVVLLMQATLDIFRDPETAISIGKIFLKSQRDPEVELKLIDVYLATGKYPPARELQLGLKGAVDSNAWLQLEARICEYEGRFQDAIDRILSLPNRRDFEEKHTSTLAYLELLLKQPAKALKRCKAFLDARSFHLSLESELVNYECAKKMEGRDVSKKRLEDLRNSTDSDAVKGVCLFLLDQPKEAMLIFRGQVEKRFSLVYDLLRWPAVAELRPEFEKLRDELLRAKRGPISYKDDC